MFDYTQLKQYTFTVTNLRFPIEKNDGEPFALIYFPENGSELVYYYQHLNLRRDDMKFIIIPQSTLPLVIYKTEVLQEFRLQSLYTYSKVVPPLYGRNIMVDFSYYLKTLDIQYHPPDYKSRFGNMIQDYLKKQIIRIGPNHKIVLLYVIDLDKDFAQDYLIRKSHCLYQELLKTPDLCDDFLICELRNKKPTYRLMIKDTQFEKNRLLTYFRKLNPPSKRKETLKSIILGDTNA